MKRRPRTLEQICCAFADHLFTVDANQYLQGRSDLVVFSDGVIARKFIWTVLFNPINGNFLCSPTGTETRTEMATEDSAHMRGNALVRRADGDDLLPGCRRRE